MPEEEKVPSEEWKGKWGLGLSRPWIYTDNYVGPDRRGSNSGHRPEFGERRVRTPAPEEISLDDFPGQDVFK